MVVRIPEVLWMTDNFNKDLNALATLCYLPQESLLLLILSIMVCETVAIILQGFSATTQFKSSRVHDLPCLELQRRP